MTSYVDVSSCNQWYMYEFEDNVNQTDKEFFGYNTGYPIINPNSTGVLDQKYNFMAHPCNSSNRSSPYFKEFTKEAFQGNKSMNDYLIGISNKLNEAPISFKDKNFEVPILDDLPDGGFKIREVNSQTLDYNVQVNNYRYWQYHRNNGVTKIGLLDPETNIT